MTSGNYVPSYHLRIGRRIATRKAQGKCRKAKKIAIKRCSHAGKTSTCRRAIRSALKKC